MIKITRLNKAQSFVNVEMIEQVEFTPDTVISLAIEPQQEVVNRIVRYKRRTIKQLVGPGKNRRDTT